MLSHQDSEAWSVAIELHDEPDAEEKLGGAIENATENANTALEAQARVALGIYYQHHGRLEDALTFLDHALSGLEQSEADYAAGRYHLDVLNSGFACNCFDEALVVGRAIRDFVLERVPEGLISHFAAEVKEDGNVNLEIEVTRELTGEEEQVVNATIDEALQVYSP